MDAYYQLILQRPLTGFSQELFLPELYREQRRIDPLLLRSELFTLGERLDVARLGGIHWQLGLELEFA